jgi:hypothetical protein
MRRTLIAVVLSGTALLGLVAAVPAASASPGVVQLDGCSGPTPWTNWAVPERTWFYDFTEACRNHDIAYAYRSYGNSEAGRAQADLHFLWDMKTNCAPKWYPASAFCNDTAWNYYGAVRQFGGGFYSRSDPSARAQVRLA